MNQMTKRIRNARGFTLVELLIVVIILAILAAIVVPQFASSTDDAKLSALDSNLANMRAALDLYYQQHGAYPGAVDASGAGDCPTGGAAATAAQGAVGSAGFVTQLTFFTNAAGKACTKKDANYKYGPYLKKSLLPDNPITDNNGLSVVTTGTIGMASSLTDASGGWKYDSTTGQFIADDHRLVQGSTTEYYDQR